MLVIAKILPFPVTSYITRRSRDISGESKVQKIYSHIRCKKSC